MKYKKKGIYARFSRKVIEMAEMHTIYANYLDELRRDNRIKVSDFCDGVCNERTYRRYQSGEAIMSQVMMNKFVRKLGLDLNGFLRFCDREAIKERTLVDEFYYAIDDDPDLARERMKELHNHKFQNTRNEELFKFCVVQYNLKNKMITRMEAYETFSKMIDYDTISQKKYFDMMDAFVLHQLCVLENYIDIQTTLEITYNALTGNGFDYFSGDHRDIMPALYQTVSRGFGARGDLKRSLEIADLGVAYSKKYHTLHLLKSLYYYQALAYYPEGDMKKTRQAVIHCIGAALAEQAYDWLEILVPEMVLDFGEDPLTYFHVTSVEELKQK